MQKIKVTITLMVKADRDDEDGLKEAIYDKVMELVEADELDFSIPDEEDDEDYED